MFRATLSCVLLCTAVPTLALPAAQEKALVDRIGETMATTYVFPEKVPGIMAKLRHKAKSGAYASLDPQATAKAMTSDLRDFAADGHMHLRYYGDGIPKDDQGADDASIIAEMRATGKADNWGFTSAEMKPGGIGILKIDLFYPPQEAASTLAGAMRFLANSKALVIDLRGNHGGEPDTVALLLSHLLPVGTHLNTTLGRGGKDPHQTWTTAVPDDLRFNGPVYVLIGPHTASAGEEAAYDLKVLKRATIIGETSIGAANPGDMVPLDDHFALFIPNERAENPVTKTNWEGTGVAPDIRTPVKEALDVALKEASGS